MVGVLFDLLWHVEKEKDFETRAVRNNSEPSNVILIWSALLPPKYKRFDLELWSIKNVFLSICLCSYEYGDIVV